MRSGLLSRGRMEPNRARPPLGGVPYMEPGVVSPTQPTSMTAGAVDGDGEGVAEPDGLAAPDDVAAVSAATPVPEDGAPPSFAITHVPAAAANTTTAETIAKMTRRRRRTRRRVSRSVTYTCNARWCGVAAD